MRAARLWRRVTGRLIDLWSQSTRAVEFVLSAVATQATQLRACNYSCAAKMLARQRGQMLRAAR